MRKEKQRLPAARPPEQLALDFGGPARTGPLFPPAGLPRDPAERGHRAFKAEREEAIRAFQDRFGLILNRRVRVRIEGWDEDLEGKLVVAQLLLPASRKEELRLRIGKAVFDAREILMCMPLPEKREQSA